MAIELEARNADLGAVVSILQEQRARRLDLITSATAISSQDASLFIEKNDASQVVTDEGVTSAAGLYRLTKRGDETLGEKLAIPTAYLKALRAEGRTDLYDMNVNGKLHGLTVAYPGAGDPEVVHPAMTGKMLLRLLKGDEGEPGVVRAILSPRYRIMDNLDVLLAAMDGIRQAGVTAYPSQADLTESRLYARFEAPEVSMLAPKLLDGYRSVFNGPGAVERAGEDRPDIRFKSDGGGWTPQAALAAAAGEGMGYEPGTEPVVWAGFIVSNSDTGGGARTLAPQIRVRVCRNGLTLVAEADRKVHLGSEQAEGVVNWSAETQEQELRLITAQARDAVKTYLSHDFLAEQVAKIEALAGAPVAKPEATIKAAAQAVGFTKAEAEGILGHFLRGGQMTAAGVANAVTSYSQTIADADRAAELDGKALKAMEHAAA